MLTALNICPIEGAGESKSARVKADTTSALHCNKSHLIEEFHARLREVPHTWAEWSCSQLLQLPLQQTPMERRMRKSQTHSGPSVRSPAMTSAPPQSENHVGLTFWKNALTVLRMVSGQ
jgi:hypothetical protein